jgi:hypothetical protein
MLTATPMIKMRNATGTVIFFLTHLNLKTLPFTGQRNCAKYASSHLPCCRKHYQMDSVRTMISSSAIMFANAERSGSSKTSFRSALTANS